RRFILVAPPSISRSSPADHIIQYKPSAMLCLSFRSARRFDFTGARTNRYDGGERRGIAMNCPHCQATLADNARFCAGCGTAVARPETSAAGFSEAATQVMSAPSAAADPLIGRTLEDKYQITGRV